MNPQYHSENVLKRELNATIYSLFILEDLNSHHSFCGACTPATFIIRNRLLDGCLTTNIPFTLQ